MTYLAYALLVLALMELALLTIASVPPSFRSLKYDRLALTAITFFAAAVARLFSF